MTEEAKVKRVSSGLTPQAKEFVKDFLEFINEAVSPYHAVQAAAKRLIAAGFVAINEKAAWELQKGGKYYLIRHDSTIIAFTIGTNFQAGNAFVIAGAHTDSPCLRIKPNPVSVKQDALVLNIQPYGGGLWHTWFDRDLGIAGRVIVRNEEGNLERKFVKIDTPVARIPNLAIHLQTSSEREAFSPNLQEHAKAILTMNPDLVKTDSKFGNAFGSVLASILDVPEDNIVDTELQLIDLQPSTIGGLSGELVFSGRLDNLCSSYQCLRALIDSATSPSEGASNQVQVVMLFDHEEVGSSSLNGAGSNMFVETLKQIDASFSTNPAQTFPISLRKSFVLSIDMAHAQHPNYSAKHDPCMAPRINKGLVIKYNSNQRYATNAISASIIREVARLDSLPLQEFTVKADSACGSTIGPITSTLSGILTVDLGSPQFSMHSIREMMGGEDVLNGYLVVAAAFKNYYSVAKPFKL